MQEPIIRVRPEHAEHIRAVITDDPEGALAVLEEAAHLSTTVLAPMAERADEELLFPREQVQQIFAHGFGPMSVPMDLGGRGVHPLVEAYVFELLGAGCASSSLTTSIHAAVVHAIARIGSQEQRKTYLPKLISGEWLAAFALTEPQSGSNAIRMMETTATPQPDGTWRLNGAKMYITNSGEADVYLVFARTPDGPAALLMHRDTPGFVIGPTNLPKLGLRANRLARLEFHDCPLPTDAVVGPIGDGRSLARWTLGGGRLAVAAMCAGIAQTALDKATCFGAQRMTSRGPVTEVPAIAHKLERSQRALLTMRAMIAGTAAAIACATTTPEQVQISLLQTKIWCSEVAQDICNDAIQVCGGAAYVWDGNLHRHWRDVRLYTIGEGTTEVLAAELNRLDSPSIWKDEKVWEQDLI